MCNDEAGAAVHQAVHAALHQRFGAGIDGGGGLVQDQHRGIGHGRAGDGQQLALSLREVGTIAGKHGVVALRQTLDEAVGVGKAGGGDALFISSLQPAVADILHHRAGEQVGVLQHDAQRTAQVGLFDLVDVDAVVADLAVLNVVEPVDEVGNGGLARTGGADKGDLLAGAAIEVDAVQDGLLRHIAEVHVRKSDVTRQLVVGSGAIVVGVLPCPQAGALVRLHQLVVAVVLCVDKGHIAFVGLAGFIHHLEDALSTGQCHDDAVGLHGHLTDGHVEALVQAQESHHRAKGRAAHAAHGHGCACQRADGIADVAQLGVDRHHDVGKAVGFVGAVLQLVVQLAETVQRLLLVGEHLDDLLAFHHFFDVAVQLAQIPLLLDEVFAGLLGDLFGAEHHQRHHQHGDNRQLPAEHAHAEEHRNNGNGAGHQLRDALTEHLAQGIHIVGVHGHDIAMGMLVKIFDGQALHVGEQLGAQVAQGALRHIDHDAGVAPRCQNANDVDDAHPQQSCSQRGEIRILLLGHGHDVIVHQGL